MKTPSEKQVEANRRNAMRSTGPRTEAGKARSRMNGLVHGMAAEVVVREEDRPRYQAELDRWDRDAGPCNAVERHLIRRAAVGAVRADRIERAREENRGTAAHDAAERWRKRRQARARKLAQTLALDPSNVLPDLESSAFGCDWLIGRWQALDALLRVGAPWDQLRLTRTQHLLGLPEGTPAPDADPALRALWILAEACSPGRITRLPRVSEAEARLPAEPGAARQALRAMVAGQLDRVERLRDDAWQAVEGPECRSVAVAAAAADTAPDAQLHHRYEVASDRSANAAVRLYLNIRDRRRREQIELAKAAQGCTLLRVPVGGGWWCEVDAAPAPPGFSPLDPLPDPKPPTPAPDGDGDGDGDRGGPFAPAPRVDRALDLGPPPSPGPSTSGPLPPPSPRPPIRPRPSTAPPARPPRRLPLPRRSPPPRPPGPSSPRRSPTSTRRPRPGRLPPPSPGRRPPTIPPRPPIGPPRPPAGPPASGTPDPVRRSGTNPFRPPRDRTS
ncbi:hypothetical protein [Tautonia plasticadhaerens]|uniref:Uncharacterized protein n=1 Tax=Tautonia plasticadhaerens TaxID=2527974 RepID=A0A518HCF6_9BACT|nr:hypothetical protein [Tautonia plasticadhaerens]QDV38538.1 hypothetical protein ElP_64930 [Tautonia plasticadhaerens]